MWLQNKRDATLERLRGPTPRREDAHEFRVGRLKHERVCVPRDDSLLEWAMQVMKHHGDRKAVLEVRLLSRTLLTTFLKNFSVGYSIAKVDMSGSHILLKSNPSLEIKLLQYMWSQSE